MKRRKLREKKKSTFHGMSNTREYTIWSAMLARCRSPFSTGYYKYGAKGIKVCDRWLEFKNFYTDMGRRPSAKHSIDRIDNGGNYELANCRWATVVEQARNKSTNHCITIDGVTKTVAQWNEDRGFTPFLIWNRLKIGWSERDAVLKPQAWSTKRRGPIECRGEKRTVTEWSRVSGVPAYVIGLRINRYGWDADRAIFTPPRPVKA